MKPVNGNSLFMVDLYSYKRLSKWVGAFILEDNMKIDEKKREKLKKKTEKLSSVDLRELMGIDKPTYKRHKGAIRRK